MDLSEFTAPDFQAPLDVEVCLARIPAEGRVKGMLLQDLIKRLGGAPDGFATKYTVFKDYPSREYAGLVVEAARSLYPSDPMREAIRRVGRRAYPAFGETMLGKVMFGSLGRNVSAVLRLAGKAYEIASNPARVNLIDMQSDHAVFHLVDQYVFLDCLQVGVFEGCLEALGQVGSVEVKMTQPWEGHFLVRWGG